MSHLWFDQGLDPVTGTPSGCAWSNCCAWSQLRSQPNDSDRAASGWTGEEQNNQLPASGCAV